MREHMEAYEKWPVSDQTLLNSHHNFGNELMFVYNKLFNYGTPVVWPGYECRTLWGMAGLDFNPNL